MPRDARATIRETIENEVFVSGKKERLYAERELSWLFDFRRVFMKADVLDALGELFFERFDKARPFQIGGVEVSAIPLVTALLLKSNERGRPVNAFFMRKSRKRDDLARMIEGALSDEPVVLVDDLMNSGKSFIRQVEVMEALGKRIRAVFSVLRFRDLSYYSYFRDKGIEVVTLFELDDFKGTLGVRNLAHEKGPVPMPFRVEWYFRSEHPNYFYVVPKSAPALDGTRLYFGSDSGNFWAVNQADGKAAWSYKIGFHAKGKYIFSSPALYRGLVYFGAYDGNFYALDKETGKKKWMFMEADWIGSSPAVAPDLGLVFVGLEFGLWRKQGGIVALDALSGEKIWEYAMPEFVHSSPAYSAKLGIVVIGGNDGTVRAFGAKRGDVRWEIKAEGEVKASFAFDERRGLVLFGSFDSHLYAVDAKTGKPVHKVKTKEAIYSTPLVVDELAYVASLDKVLYAVNLDTGAIAWRFETNGRIFATPIAVEGKLYIGGNDGRFYELDPKTGENTAFFQATERITNAAAYSPGSGRFFVPTFANEIYCLSRGT